MSGSPLYLMDTNTTGYIISGRSVAARNRLKETKEYGSVAISCVTEAEILYGLELRPGAVRLRAAVGKLFDAVPLRAWDSAAAEAYGRLRARLRADGKTLSAMDLLIAAHAMSLRAVLVTHDGAFQQVSPFVSVVDWAEDL